MHIYVFIGIVQTICSSRFVSHVIKVFLLDSIGDECERVFGLLKTSIDTCLMVLLANDLFAFFKVNAF